MIQIGLVVGIETLFVTVPPVKDLNDRMLSGVRGLFAEYERAKISERFRIGKINRLHKGNVLVSEAPYGYKYIVNCGKKGDKEYVVGHYQIDEAEAEVVRDIFVWVADEGLTLRGVVRRLQERGIKPRKSIRGVWSTSTLSNLMHNETYIGIAHWGVTYAVAPLKPLKKDEKYKKNKKTSRRMNTEDKWYEIAVPRILVNDDLFHRANRKLKANFALVGRDKKNNYLLSGKIWCTCGRRRTGEGPQQGKHLYYRCTNRVYSFPLPRSCFEKGINARIADSVVWERVEELMRSPELLNSQIERYKMANKNTDTKKTLLDVDGTKKQIVKLKTQMQRYETLFTEDLITLEKMKEHHAIFTKEITELENILLKFNLEKKIDVNVSYPSYDEIKFFAKEFRDYTDSLSFEAKKGIIATSLDKVYSNPTGLHVYGSFNLTEIYVKYFSRHRNRRSPKCR
jgi:site-specific DNA recombinase